MRRLSAALLACCLPFAAAPAFADVTLVMFRHAEKPAAGLGQLNCQRLNRALALPKVLLGKFGRPAAIYAPNPGIAKEDEAYPSTTCILSRRSNPPRFAPACR